MRSRSERRWWKASVLAGIFVSAFAPGAWDARAEEAAPAADAPYQDPSVGYTRRLKEQLLEAEGEGERNRSAIADVKAGKTSLSVKPQGEIRNAFAMRGGAVVQREVTALSGTDMSTFGALYTSSNWMPNFYFSYEYQLFHSETAGSVGVGLNFGYSYFHGLRIERPENKDPIEKKYRLYLFPLTPMVNYRFNLPWIIRPYVMGGPTIMPYFETINHELRIREGTSYGYAAAAGANILLDWVSKESSWSLYEAFGVKHFYITAEYSMTSTFSGDVRMSNRGVYAGLTVEY